MKREVQKLRGHLSHVNYIAAVALGSCLWTMVTSANENDDFEVLWSDLEKEEPKASRAILLLASTPDETVSFLTTKLKPFTLNSARAKTLLEALRSDEKSVWESAFMELEYFDPRLAIDLKTLMDEVTDSPARERIVEVLSDRGRGAYTGKKIELREVGNLFTDEKDFNFRVDGAASWAEHKISRLRKRNWTRAVRALVLLQHIGSPEAIEVLAEMATGHPDAQPTQVAKEAIKRLGSGTGD